MRGTHESDVVVRFLQGLLNWVRAPNGDRVFSAMVFPLNEVAASIDHARIEEALLWTTNPWTTADCTECYTADHVAHDAYAC